MTQSILFFLMGIEVEAYNSEYVYIVISVCVCVYPYISQKNWQMLLPPLVCMYLHITNIFGAGILSLSETPDAYIWGCAVIE